MTISKFEIWDSWTASDSKKIPVSVWSNGGSLYLHPMLESKMVHEAPICLEYYQGSIRLLVYADENQEDPTHIIPLDDVLGNVKVEG